MREKIILRPKFWGNTVVQTPTKVNGKTGILTYRIPHTFYIYDSVGKKVGEAYEYDEKGRFHIYLDRAWEGNGVYQNFSSLLEALRKKFEVEVRQEEDVDSWLDRIKKEAGEKFEFGGKIL